MQEDFVILQKCPLFSDICEADLSAMLGCLGAKVLSFDRQETILAEGEPARYVGILLSGAAQIQRVDYYGNRSILANVSVGELFGESFACAGVQALPVQVVALEESRVLRIDCSRILRSCSNACAFHQQMIYNLMQVVAAKNLIFHQKLEILSQRTIRDKLMTYLLLQAKRAGSNRFTIPFDRQALADYLEVERSGVSLEISKLRKEGVLKNRKNQFELL